MLISSNIETEKNSHTHNTNQKPNRTNASDTFSWIEAACLKRAAAWTAFGTTIERALKDRAGYRRACAGMLARCQARRIRPYHAARACTLGPDSADAGMSFVRR